MSTAVVVMRITMKAILLVIVLSPSAAPVDNSLSFSRNEGDIDDFERNHPVIVDIFRMTYTSVNVTWSIENHADQADLANFIILYYKSAERKTSPYKTIYMPSNETSVVIEGLLPGTSYNFFVVANYSTGHMPYSYHYKISTRGVAPEDCRCNRTGAVANVTCDYRTGQCKCVNKNTVGLHCDKCVKRYVWIPRIGCESCDCNSKRSDGTCYINSKGIKMCNCVKQYGGKRCDFCAPGYFGNGVCQPCLCNNNTKPNVSRACDMKTGLCLHCAYNTTGNNCEKCMLGYEGDPVKAKNCTKYEDLFSPPRHSLTYRLRHNIGTIVGVCIALLIVVLLVLAVIVYRKCWHWRQKPLQFWTVELKDDRERVSFSSLPSNPDYQHVDAFLPNNDDSFTKGYSKSRCQDNVKITSKPRTRAAGDGSTNPYKSLEET